MKCIAFGGFWLTAFAGLTTVAVGFMHRLHVLSRPSARLVIIAHTDSLVLYNSDCKTFLGDFFGEVTREPDMVFLAQRNQLVPVLPTELTTILTLEEANCFRRHRGWGNTLIIRDHPLTQSLNDLCTREQLGTLGMASYERTNNQDYPIMPF